MIDWSGMREISAEQDAATITYVADEIAGIIEEKCDTPEQATDILRGIIDALQNKPTSLPYKGIFLVKKARA